MNGTEHRVKRAILMAAGRGERLRPLTEQTPKPLLRVRGVPMIESMIGALRRQGITEIHVVAGYRMEQFQYLADKYPGLSLVENPVYDRYNNISSLYAAREYLEDVLIADADQIVEDDRAVAPVYARSGYNAVWTAGSTKEWLLQLRDGIVTSCSRTGGSEGWQLYSISRWTAEDGRILRERLEETYAREENRQLYWDDVPLFCCPQDFRLGIYEMERQAVTEIDTLRELAMYDSQYAAFAAEGSAGK